MSILIFRRRHHTVPPFLVFSTQPGGANSGSAFSPQPVVTAKNPDGTTKTSFTGNVTLAVNTVTGSHALGGTVTVAAVAGVATFSGVTDTGSGDGTLTATAAGYSSATSASFTTAAAAGVTVNTPTTNSVGANTTTLAVTHTVPSGAKYLDVRIAYRKNGSQVVSSLASDVGGALTLQQGAWEVTVAGVYHAVYTLANPAAGAHTITLTLDQQAARITMSAASISGATSLTSAQAKDDVTNAAPSVTIASAAGQLVIASIAHYDATATLTISETEIANSAGANDSLGCRQHVYSKAGAASTTVSGTLSGAQDWVALAVAYAP